ncbi:unnamed protein product [Pichia kudriavzevii]
MVQTVTWEDVEQQGNPLLSPAVKSNGHVFTSGCLGTDKNGKIPESLVEQTENAIRNLQKVLDTSGSSLDKVLKVLLFISDASFVGEVNKVYGKYFKSKPSRSCVVVGFPNKAVKVEIECVAEFLPLSAKL